MTIEEAIKRIENHMEVHKIWKYPHIQLKEALDMAITALRAQATIVHCKGCKHLYFKDFEAFCPHRVGPCKPSGFCDCGERSEDSNGKTD